MVNSNINKDSNKEMIFLCKKVKKSLNKKDPIFYINKIRKIGKENVQFDFTFDSTTDLENRNEKIPSIDEIVIPSFFNDIKMKKKVKVQQKLRKYSEASTQFNDLEDAEVYLIRKESLYLEKEF